MEELIVTLMWVVGLPSIFCLVLALVWPFVGDHLDELKSFRADMKSWRWSLDYHRKELFAAFRGTGKDADWRQEYHAKKLAELEEMKPEPPSWAWWRLNKQT